MKILPTSLIQWLLFLGSIALLYWAFSDPGGDSIGSALVAIASYFGSKVSSKQKRSIRTSGAGSSHQNALPPSTLIGHLYISDRLGHLKTKRESFGEYGPEEVIKTLELLYKSDRPKGLSILCDGLTHDFDQKTAKKVIDLIYISDRPRAAKTITDANTRLASSQTIEIDLIL